MDLCFRGLFSMLAALILWGACLLVFIASPNQKFTHIRPNKFASWCIFLYSDVDQLSSICPSVPAGDCYYFGISTGHNNVVNDHFFSCTLTSHTFAF
jgi:hypothetical protein